MKNTDWVFFLVDLSTRFSFISTRFNEIQGSNKNNDENQALNLTTETGKYGYERGEAESEDTLFIHMTIETHTACTYVDVRLDAT